MGTTEFSGASRRKLCGIGSGLDILDYFAVMAEALDSKPLMAILGDAISGAREELRGCRRLRENFEAQEEQIQFETA